MTDFLIGETDLSIAGPTQKKLGTLLAQLPAHVQRAMGGRSRVLPAIHRAKLPSDDDLVFAASDPKPAIENLRESYLGPQGTDPRGPHGRPLLHTTVAERGPYTIVSGYRWGVSPNGIDTLERTHRALLPTAELLKVKPEDAMRVIAGFLALSPEDAAKRTPEDLIKAMTAGTPTALPNGTPTTLPNGTPTALPNGTPTALPNGTPTALPNGTPTALPNGTPTALPNGTPTALLNPSSSGYQRYAPTGAGRGMLDDIGELQDRITIEGRNSRNVIHTQPRATPSSSRVQPGLGPRQ